MGQQLEVGNKRSCASSGGAKAARAEQESRPRSDVHAHLGVHASPSGQTQGPSSTLVMKDEMSGHNELCSRISKNKEMERANQEAVPPSQPTTILASPAKQVA